MLQEDADAEADTKEAWDWVDYGTLVLTSTIIKHLLLRICPW